MTTYIINTKGNTIVAVEASSKKEAIAKVNKSGYKAIATSAQRSSCHIDFVQSATKIK